MNFPPPNPPNPAPGPQDPQDSTGHPAGTPPCPQGAQPPQPGHPPYPPPGAQSPQPSYPPASPPYPPPGAQYRPPGPPYPQAGPQGYGPGRQADDPMWAMLSYILSFVVGFLAPLVIYLVKMRESQFVRFHAAQGLNLGLTALIYSVALFAVGIPLAIVTHGIALILAVLLLIALGIAHVVFLIIGAVKSGQGELYQFPVFICLRMVR